MTVTRLGQITAETGSIREGIATGLENPQLDNRNPRSGNYCWDVGFGNGVGYGITFPLQSGIRANFASRASVNTGGSGGYIFVLHSSTDDRVFRMLFNDDYEFDVVVDEVLLHTETIATTPYVAGTVGMQPEEMTWNDVGVFYQSGVDGVASIYLNGELFFTYTGNLPGNLDYFVTHERGSIFAGFIHAGLDDLYVDGLTSDEPDSIPSRKIFLPSYPSNQLTAQFTPIGDTPNYRCVDEQGAPDNDTTYVKTLENGVEDIYSLTPVSIPVDYKIRAVIPTAVARKGDTGLDAQISLISFDGAIKDMSPDKFVPPLYTPIWHRYDLQPNDDEWLETNYESYAFGFRATGAF